MNDRVFRAGGPAASPPFAGQPDLALPVGMRLGAFEIQRVIARGAGTVVYLATDHALAMPVAIQEYLPAPLVRRDAGLRLVAAAPWHDDLIARGLHAFVDEARMLARCEHPSLVRVQQLFHSHGSAFRVMPVYAGRRLSEVRPEMTAAPDEASLRALLDALLGAIAAVHRSGQVHGGVSAQNILLLADDRPLLLGPGAVAREIDSDLVASLMATLEPPARTVESDTGSPPTGTALDLYGLAEVMRFCILGEPAAAPEALHRREPLRHVIARAMPAEARPPYSAALLGALDAAVSPYAEDRPLSVAQFRDWLVRGVPAVPGRGPARPGPSAAPDLAVPATQAVDPADAIAAPSPAPAPEPAERPPPFWPHAEEPAPASATRPAADEPLAPWPAVVRATDAPFARPADPSPPPLPPQLQRLTGTRPRRHAWLMGGALALLAAGALVVATGAWNRVTEIPLGPQGTQIETALPARGEPTLPAPGRRDAPLAEAPPRPRNTTEVPDPARLIADEPPGAGPAPSAPRTSPDNAAARPALTAPPRAPPRASPRAEPNAAPRSPRAAATQRGNPRAACAGRSDFALYRCMWQQCQAKRWTAHPQCQKLRRDDRVD